LARRKVFWSFFVAIVWLAASCSSGNPAGTNGGSDGGADGADASSPAPAQGSEKAPCYPNSTCNAGLECLRGLCVRGPDGGGPTDATIGDDATTIGDDAGSDGSSPPDSGSRFVQVVCPGSGTTALQGTVYDPAGQIPLYDVAVYVPTTPPVTLPPGASCGSCQAWYTAPLVSAVTDAAGNFTIRNMPVGQNIPLIVQVGKWRRQYTLSNVTPCVANDAATLAGTKLRMPKNHLEGDIPNIAVSTGAADSLECLFSRMGLDAAEYTGDPAGAGRIHVFTGGDVPNGRGGAQTNAPVSKASYQYLWNADASMTQYDLVLLACEGSETSYLNDAARTVLSDYANAGGRVFASHYHYSWFTPTGPFSTLNPSLATWSTGNGIVGSGTSAYYADIVTTLPNGMPFPAGAMFKQWLQNVGALADGGLPLYYARDNATVTSTNSRSQPWIALDPSSPAPNATEYFSFDNPYDAGPNQQCGRVVYSDLHVSGGAGSQDAPGVPPDYPGLTSGGIVPDGCASHALTPQERALEFMVFDLSSCRTPVTGQP
jgi:hypothetical protein